MNFFATSTASSGTARTSSVNARRIVVASVVSSLAAIGCASGNAVAQPTAPTTVTAEVTTTQAAAANVSPDLAAILDRLHRVGVEMKTLRAKVSMTTVDWTTSGRASERRGRILLERRGDGDTRARVEFDQLITGTPKARKLVEERLEYLLTGDWVTDRVYRRPGDADGGNRETKRQIRPEGSKTDLLKLGAGPFPLPIGQPREAVLKQFAVKSLPDDPAKKGLVGVELKPLETNELREQFSSIVVWIARDQSLPSVIETVDRNESQLKTTTLSEVTLNGPVTDADFELERIDPKDWTTLVEPLRTR